MTFRSSSRPSPPAAVITVGDELLLGQTVDTNGAWLSQELSRIGLTVVSRWVTGDVLAEIKGALRCALDCSEVVVLTGGLGPTPDDITREAVADFLGQPLRVDKGLTERLQDRFRARGLGDLPERSLAMASVPAGAHVLPNPVGAAPGLVLEAGGGRFCVLLPGVPEEMKGIFLESVEPFLEGRLQGRLKGVVHRVFHTVGIPESLLASRVEDLLSEGPGDVTLAYLPDGLGVRLRISSRASDGMDMAEARLRQVEERLHPVLAEYGYESETGDLAEAVGRALLSRGETLAVAESCTGGLISKRMTDIPGSSRYFLGGVVSYANEVKCGMLGISEERMRHEGVVSEWTAAAMAEAAVRTLGSSVGLGVTGIAGPGGGSPEKPVGTVWLALSRGGKTEARVERFLGDRGAVRARAAHASLGMLLRSLAGVPS